MKLRPVSQCERPSLMEARVCGGFSVCEVTVSDASTSPMPTQPCSQHQEDHNAPLPNISCLTVTIYLRIDFPGRGYTLQFVQL